MCPTLVVSAAFSCMNYIVEYTKGPVKSFFDILVLFANGFVNL